MVRLRGVFESVLVDRVYRLLIILSLVAGAYVWYRQESFINCIAEYNDIKNNREVVLQKFSDREYSARKNMNKANHNLFTNPLFSIPGDKRTPEQNMLLLQLFSIYQKSLVDLDREQTELDKVKSNNPIPEPPKVRCN